MPGFSGVTPNAPNARVLTHVGAGRGLYRQLGEFTINRKPSVCLM
jgi:hypothetical protein